MTQPNPYFGSRQEVLESLRLGASASDAPVQAIVDDGIIYAGMRMRRDLGTSLTSLQAVASVPRPQNDLQHRRVAAELLERLLVRVHLLTVDSALVREGSPGYLQAWNREGFLRGSGADERERMITNIETKIGELVGFITAESLGTAPNGFRAFAVEPSTVRKPFDSVGLGGS